MYIFDVLKSMNCLIYNYPIYFYVFVPLNFYTWQIIVLYLVKFTKYLILKILKCIRFYLYPDTIWPIINLSFLLMVSPTPTELDKYQVLSKKIWLPFPNDTVSSAKKQEIKEKDGSKRQDLTGSERQFLSHWDIFHPSLSCTAHH